MSYQALLFCPDEKAARTVTQILSDLDFSVTACTEPFAAVKKFMGERFDAVVVDCDNEQNATLLFKSARSAPNNQGALAVAVVEGQAGVAKAFRIGANLVLTKPINVEQAKGTLRVARGLLRKNEGAKPANPGLTGTAAQKPQEPIAAKPTLQPVLPNRAEARTPAPEPRTPASSAGISVPTIPIQKPVAPPAIAASAPVAIGEESVSPGANSAAAESSDQTPQTTTVSSSAAGPTSPKIATAPTPQAEGRISSGFAASAPAPARAPMENAPAESAKSTGPANQDFEVDAKEHTASPDKTLASAPTPTFGGKVSSGQEPAPKGSKTKLIAAVAAVLIAIGGYAAWMKWSPVSAPAKGPVKVSAQPAPTTAPVAPIHSIETPTSVAQTQTTASTTDGAQTAKIEKPDIQKPASIAKEDKHPAKVSAAPEKPERENSVVAENAPLASTPAPQPLVIKSGNLPAPSNTPESAEAPALNVTGGTPTDQGLPNLGSTTAATPVLQRLVISQGVSRGLLVKQVPPVYPPAAIQMRIEGAVELQATIAKTGNISAVKVLSGDNELAHAAIDAVKQWKYKPYLLNGEPVDIQTQITVKFKLPE
jgi:periplasmic protein TonB